MRILMILAAALCALATPAAAELISRTVTTPDGERTYIADVVPGHSGRVIFALHPGLATSEGWRAQSELSAVPGAGEFVIVYPQGYERTWNVGDCCDPAATAGIDEPVFIEAILADLATFTTIAPGRHFATGFSNGGSLTWMLGCRRPDLIGAIAPMGSAYTVEEGEPCDELAETVAVFYGHGELDQTSPFNGGYSNLNGVWRAGHQDMLDAMLMNRPYAGTVERFPHGRRGASSVACDEYIGIADFVFCPIPNMGHWWPGYSSWLGRLIFGPPRRELPGAEEVIDFFAAQ